MHDIEDIISQLTLRCKGTFACFDIIFTRGTTYDFLFAFFDKELELLLKERICSCGIKLFFNMKKEKMKMAFASPNSPLSYFKLYYPDFLYGIYIRVKTNNS